MSFTHATSTNNYGPAKLIVATSAANGTHTTLASALAAASSGDTIFIRDSLTENVTVSTSVTISSLDGCPRASSVSITGKITISAAITVVISGLELVTNSDNCLVVSGSAASIVTLTNCLITASNNTAIAFSSSSASSKLTLLYSAGDITTTGIAFFAHSGAGTMKILNGGKYRNSGSSTTNSTVSGTGNLTIENCGVFQFQVTTSSSCTLSIDNSRMNVNPGTLILGSSGTQTIRNTDLQAGSNVGVTCTGSNISILNSIMDSSNTNAIDGAGSVKMGQIDFPSSSLVATTTKTHKPIGESGTFTPTIDGATPGTTTYTSQQGFYSVIGSMVYIWGKIVITAATGTGNAQIGGLPFANNTGIQAGGIALTSGAGWAWTAGRTYITYNISSSNIGTMQGSGTLLGTNAVQMANAALTLTFSTSYRIA